MGVFMADMKLSDKGEEAKNRADFYIDLLCHDINNMNQAALGYLELASDMLSQGKYDPALLAKPIEILKNGSQLVESVRKIQKANFGGQQLEKLDLGALLKGVISQYSSVPGRDVSIIYEPAEGGMVMASELLKDVFSNLIGNSIKHSSGPLNINISLSEVVEANRAYYRVDISDDGPGIPDELKKTIFDHFSGGAWKPEYKGLGLYIVKALVNSFNGSVWVEDRVPGDHTRGARFVVLLPAAKKGSA